MKMAIQTAHSAARLCISNQQSDDSLRSRSYRAGKVCEMEMSKVIMCSIIECFLVRH